MNLSANKKSLLLTLCVVAGLSLLFSTTTSFAKPEPTAGAGFVRENTIDGKGSYKDGVYQGSAPGYAGDVTMEVEVQNGHIMRLNVLSHSDDLEYFEPARDEILPRVFEADGTNVDGKSGATFSSYGMLDAIDDALAQAQ